MISNLGILICAIVALIVLSTLFIMSRYRRCRPDEILIKYGQTGKDGRAKIITGGGAFIWPIIHSYATMSLRPIQLKLDIKEAAAKGMIRTNVPTNISVVISNDPALQEIAVKRLLGMTDDELRNLIKETLYGQVRMVIARMSVEELNNNRDKFAQEVEINVNNELKKYGLELKTINIDDIRDNSRIIDNLGEQAKAEADKIAQVNIATQKREKLIQVAEQQKIEESTVANTNKERMIAIAEAERERETAVAKAQAEQDAAINEAEATRDIRNAEANKKAKIGENKANEEIAKSQAELAVVQAEAAQKKGEADAIAVATVKRTTETQAQLVEEARAKKVEATLTADEIVPAKVAREKVEIEADAVAEKAKREAQGEADAILLKAKAEAEAIRLKGEAEGAAKAALLKADADNFTQMLEASQSHPEIAVQFKMVDNYVKIAEAQAEAYQNLKLGDVKVYGNADTAGDFMSKLMGSIAPTFDMLRSMPLPGKVQDMLAEETIPAAIPTAPSKRIKNSVNVTDVKFADPK